MQTSISLKQLSLCVWILEEIQKSGDEGLSLAELDLRIRQRSKGEESLSRSSLTRRRKEIERFFGIIIACPNKKQYRILNPEQLSLDTIANDLLASVQEYLFLDEYRDLGSRIQPSEIRNGMEFLHIIGDAIRQKCKLKIRYQKFLDQIPYEAIIHPYCLKASLGRWYVVGYKERNIHGSEVQAFALDRTHNISLLKETFIANEAFNPEDYFKDSYGIWVDKDNYPVRNLTIAVHPYVASYLRTLPLHHSQKELSKKHSEGWILFSFCISLTPDFMGELNRWGKDLEIVNIE